MIIDSLLEFSKGQAPTSTGDTVSTNVVDTGAAHDEGIGEPMYLHIGVTEGVTSGGSATVAFALQTSADNASWSDVVVTKAYNVADLTAGKQIAVRLPIGLQRYIRVAYRIGTAALTGGAFNAYLVKDVSAQAYYASGFSIDDDA